MKKLLPLLLAAVLLLGLLAGCAAKDGGAASAANALVIGDTTFNPENGEGDVNPHSDYSGWACIRYGIGETLVHYSDAMEIEPWLAVDWENDGGIVAGTGPFVATECESGDHLTLVKNETYWGGEVKVDQVTIQTISDGNTLAAALQSGEIDCAYGMGYESYPLFENDGYTFSTIATSRCFFVWMNYESPVVSDPAVRKAIAMGINKQGFVDTLLEGHGSAANGAFPAGFAFGGDKVTTETYDPEGARQVLEAAGWVDADGDGIREKDGQPLTIRWLTYPSRQELPLLAESAQAALKDIGIDVTINSTADHNTIVTDPTQWDVYASAQVNAPTGDPEYFFTVCCLDSSAKNKGHFHSDALEALEAQMAGEFDPAKRAALAVEMQQAILDDNGYVFCSFLEMNQISRSGVKGYDAHACDYYQLTANLEIVE